MTDSFLVYEHWRPDTSACFYVGKGKMRRARSFDARNSRYGRIVSKLKRLGLSPEIKIVRSGLTEAQAFALEVAIISIWRENGVEIANYTDGGDGTSGYEHTPATKEKIRDKAKGRVASPETRAKMSISRTGLRRSAETKSKQSASAKIAQKSRFDRMKETRAGRQKLKRRMLAMSRAAASSPELRALRSSNAKALWANPEYRAKMASRRCVSKPVVKGFS